MKRKTSESITQVRQETGAIYLSYAFREAILQGRIELDEEGRISEHSMSAIRHQIDSYISLYDYAIRHTGGNFKGELSTNRNKLLDNLESHNYYGLEIRLPREMILWKQTDEIFFLRKDISKLDRCLKTFFDEYGLTEEEKISRLIREKSSYYPDTCKYLKKYLYEYFFEDKPSPYITDVIRSIFGMEKDVTKITSQDIIKAYDLLEKCNSKTLLVNWLNYVKRNTTVRYETIYENRNTYMDRVGKRNDSYTCEQYFDFAILIFNNKYIAEHNMINKALDCSMYAEMWLYISLLYVCGWRGEDICKAWSYPNLKMREKNIFNINTSTLYEDLRNDNLQAAVYDEICEYVLGKFFLQGKMPSKTASKNTGSLKIAISKSLYPFLGLLTLIGEVHHLKNTETGYMKYSRKHDYQNRMKMEMFFGHRVIDIFGNKNFSSRRLNKNYLQSIEKEGRREGYNSILTSAVASYARSHKDFHSIKHYLNDDNFSEETIDDILFFIAERGVMGFEVFNTLVSIFPEQLEKMDMRSQNELIKYYNCVPLKLELIQNRLLLSSTIKKLFLSDHREEIIKIMGNLYNISQNKGTAKDEGTYCLLRAEGKACSYPEYKSCLANACPYLILTEYAYRPLLEIVQKYINLANAGDRKAGSVCSQVIIPRFQLIINSVMNQYNFTREEREGLKKVLLRRSNAHESINKPDSDR